jgi:hypothetical protein
MAQSDEGDYNQPAQVVGSEMADDGDHEKHTQQHREDSARREALDHSMRFAQALVNAGAGPTKKTTEIIEDAAAYTGFLLGGKGESSDDVAD